MAALAMTACGGPEVEAPGGIPTVTDTACAFAAPPTEHGTSETPFTCRGMLAELGGSVIGLVQTSKEGSYSLVSLKPDGTTAASQETPHTSKPYLVEITRGFLLISAEDDKVLITQHNTALTRVEDASSRRTMAGGEIVDFDVARWPTSGPAEQIVVATSTTTTIRAWSLNGDDDGEPVALDVLTFPEMPDCNDLKLTATAPGAWSARLRCEMIMPFEPKVADGVAEVPGFDEESEEYPDFADIRLSLTDELKVSAASAREVKDISTDPDPSYALKKYLKEQLPRDKGHRVRILDALPIGGEQAMTLACVGPDDAPATFISAALTCAERP
ncbi:MAG: hypothetical protein CMH57_03975 [Myxococcales bacterium]|nr:hypothetical protein [Myxococcales bacterium]